MHLNYYKSRTLTGLSDLASDQYVDLSLAAPSPPKLLGDGASTLISQLEP